MSRENVELVRALIPPPEVDLAPVFRDDALFEETSGPLQAFIDREIESIAEWMGGRRYTGIAGFRRLWLDWLEPWASYHVQVEDLVDCGDLVLALSRDRAERHDLQGEVDLHASSVWEIGDGRLVKVAFYTDRERAFDAAGLKR